MLERLFKLTENGTTVRTEVLAGMTTFLTMAYIIFIQPAVLSGRMFGFNTGMDFGPSQGYPPTFQVNEKQHIVRDQPLRTAGCRR
jgi:xanthine/uracil/vitamin C permease (AzgA family)